MGCEMGITDEQPSNGWKVINPASDFLEKMSQWNKASLIWIQVKGDGSIRFWDLSSKWLLMFWTWGPLTMWSMTYDPRVMSIYTFVILPCSLCKMFFFRDYLIYQISMHLYGFLFCLLRDLWNGWCREKATRPAQRKHFPTLFGTLSERGVTY